MQELEQPKLRPVALAGPISYCLALLLTLFLLTAWFDESRRAVGLTSVTPAAQRAPLEQANQSLENAGGFGIVAGLALAFLVWHPRRVLGLLPPAATVWTVTLLLLLRGLVNPTMAFICGLTAGLTAWPLMMTALRRSGLTGPFPPRDRGWLLILIPVGLGLALLLRIGLNSRPADERFWILLGLAACGTLLCWYLFFLHFLELLLEVVLAPFYRFSFAGPGVHAIPVTGPLIIVANHSCMLDPLFIGKLVPRRLIPVMTAKYYDLPVMRFLMKYVVGTIRVPVAFRRESAPELEAIKSALDQGHCILMFPEGKLRREGDPELSYFNQGIWRVLQERPNTPVICCWIEGGWGSYFSYADGPPGKGKRFDWMRPITIVVAEPEVLTEETLATHQGTRHYLTEKVADLRKIATGSAAQRVAPVSELAAAETKLLD